MKTVDSCIHIEFIIKKKSGISWIITPDGSEPVFEEIRVDNTLLKALIKAHFWKKELKRGKYESIRDLAAKKKRRITCQTPAQFELSLPETQRNDYRWKATKASKSSRYDSWRADVLGGSEGKNVVEGLLRY